MSALWRNFPLSTPVKIASRQGKKLSLLPQCYKFVTPKIKRSCTDCSVCFRQHHLGQKAIVLVNWIWYNKPFLHTFSLQSTQSALLAKKYVFFGMLEQTFQLSTETPSGNISQNFCCCQGGSVGFFNAYIPGRYSE